MAHRANFIGILQWLGSLVPIGGDAALPLPLPPPCWLIEMPREEGAAAILMAGYPSCGLALGTDWQGSPGKEEGQVHSCHFDCWLLFMLSHPWVLIGREALEGCVCRGGMKAQPPSWRGSVGGGGTGEPLPPCPLPFVPWCQLAVSPTQQWGPVRGDSVLFYFNCWFSRQSWIPCCVPQMNL